MPIKLPCPRCNVPNNFGERIRKNHDGTSDLYIMCPVCRWEKVVFTADSSIIRQYRKLQRLKARYKNSPKQLRLVEQQLKKLKNGETNK